MNRQKNTGLDFRYKMGKMMIEAGEVKSLWHLTKIVPKSVIARDLGVKVDRFTQYMQDTSLFRMKHLYDMSELFDVDVKLLLIIIGDHWKEARDKAKLHQSFLGYNKKAVS